MKPLITALALFATMPMAALAESEWTHRAEEGEDATSTHYYFYESNGESIQRVRWVWNGGAQNPPTVTEYLLGPGKITVRQLVGMRSDIPDLVARRDSKLVAKDEYSIIVRSTTEMLLPSPPATSLSDTQRIDLKNLIDLLAKERTPMKIGAQQGTGHQDLTRPATEKR